MANVKGSALASRITWVQLEHGPAGLELVIGRASPALAALIADGPRTVRWYPLALFVELNEVIDRELGAGASPTWAPPLHWARRSPRVDGKGTP